MIHDDPWYMNSPRFGLRCELWFAGSPVAQAVAWVSKTQELLQRPLGTLGTWWHYRGFPHSWPWPDIQVAIRLRRNLMEIIPVNIDLAIFDPRNLAFDSGFSYQTTWFQGWWCIERPEDLAWQRVGRKALRTLRHCSTQPCCLGPKSKREQKGFIGLLNFAQLVGTNTFQTFQTFHYNLYPSVSKSSTHVAAGTAPIWPSWSNAGLAAPAIRRDSLADAKRSKAFKIDLGKLISTCHFLTKRIGGHLTSQQNALSVTATWTKSVKSNRKLSKVHAPSLHLVTSSLVAALSIPEHSWTSYQGRLHPSWDESSSPAGKLRDNSPVISGGWGGHALSAQYRIVSSIWIKSNSWSSQVLWGATLILWMTTFWKASVPATLPVQKPISQTAGGPSQHAECHPWSLMRSVLGAKQPVSAHSKCFCAFLCPVSHQHWIKVSFTLQPALKGYQERFQ